MGELDLQGIAESKPVALDEAIRAWKETLAQTTDPIGRIWLANAIREAEGHVGDASVGRAGRKGEKHGSARRAARVRKQVNPMSPVETRLSKGVTSKQAAQVCVPQHAAPSRGRNMFLSLYQEQLDRWEAELSRCTDPCERKFLRKRIEIRGEALNRMFQSLGAVTLCSELKPYARSEDERQAVCEASTI